ncbi:MAG: hypothetical protein V2I82_04455 [Halieaceae bacterium]|jgi:hypothetical protein|nr:hypothetical protein [Halieaceae bacterium]
MKVKSVSTRAVAAALPWFLPLLFSAASHAIEPCSLEGQRLAAGIPKEVEYTANIHDPGYRFEVGGFSWELVRTQVSDPRTARRFVVTYPMIRDAVQSPATRDFFLSLEAREGHGRSCSDVQFLGDSPVHRLRISDDSDAVIRFGDLDRREKRLESIRKLATELRVRIDGTEVVIATGFATRRSLNISGCANGLDDSFGFVEYQPGQVQVTCFPADPDARDYIDEIDWRVDYQWPSNPPALLDELIDYVYIEPLRVAVD